MPITDQVIRLPVGAILVERDSRQRRKVVTDGLRESIARNGVLVPIIVRGTPEWPILVAGERRLQSSIELGLPDIIVRFMESLSPIESRIVELEENLKRSDLEWQDEVRSVAEIHALYQGLDPDWTQSETAQALCVSDAKVSQDLRIAGEWEGQPRLIEAGSRREAYNMIARTDARAAGDALQGLLDVAPIHQPTSATAEGMNLASGLPFPEPQAKAYPPSVPLPRPPGPLPEDQCILHGSFLDWAPNYQGQKFNLIHCDFPYGIDFAGGSQGKGSEPGEIYSDQPEVYWELLEAFCRHLDSFASVSCHVMFWYSAKHRTRTLEVFSRLAPSLAWHPYDLIWHKTDNAGIAADPRQGPRHVYETCLFGSRGKRQIVKVVGDTYGAPTDKRYHISTKPEPMLRHFMSMLVSDNTALLDPTCGSGAALRAAESLGARRVLGMDVDGESVETARKVLRGARSLRSASGMGTGK